MKIILASGSSRRKELLEMMGLDFEVKVSNVDEAFEKGLSIEEQSKRLAYIKAKAVFDETEGDRVIIGSDTMVLKEEKIYGKPEDKEEAIQMLQDLSGKKHKVITSICVLSQKGEEYKEQIDYDIADVYFKEITKKEIEDWIEFDKPYDKARKLCSTKQVWSSYRKNKWKLFYRSRLANSQVIWYAKTNLNINKRGTKWR